MALDYTAFNAPVDPAAVQAYRRQAKASRAPWASPKPNAVIAPVLVGVIAGPPLLGIIASILTGLGYLISNTPAIVQVVLWLLIVAGIAGLVLLSVTGIRKASVARWTKWYRCFWFAQMNNLAYSPVIESPGYAGSIFGAGSARSSIDSFRALSGRPLDVSNYRYTTGSGKSQTTHQWGFFALRLDRRLPHMVLDALSNNGLFGGTNLPAAFDKKQVLSLEGDFNRYFTLYCPGQYGTDALYVFTPDLMALLIDETSAFDVEIVDDWMYIYSSVPWNLQNPWTWERLYRIRDTVGTKTVRQTHRYRDDRVWQGQQNPYVPAGMAPAQERMTLLGAPAVGANPPPPGSVPSPAAMAHPANAHNPAYAAMPAAGLSHVPPIPPEGVVAPQGRRLKTGTRWGVLIVLGIALLWLLGSCATMMIVPAVLMNR